MVAGSNVGGAGQVQGLTLIRGVGEGAIGQTHEGLQHISLAALFWPSVLSKTQESIDDEDQVVERTMDRLFKNLRS